MNQLQVLQSLRPQGDYCVTGDITQSNIATAIRYVVSTDNDTAIFGTPSDPITWAQFIARKNQLEQKKIDDALIESNRLSSTKSKLQGLGLTVEEIKTAFGIE
tara:strand:- start:2667 stop:2975 length:309 start_codon:yes stop_codon:yes gene_type:complete